MKTIVLVVFLGWCLTWAIVLALFLVNALWR
jgi:hypothetical protein